MPQPVQGYFLSCDAERNSISDPESSLMCSELLEAFCDGALRTDHSPWESVDVHENEKNRSFWEKSYKAVRFASDVKMPSLLSKLAFVPDKLPEQRRHPAQRPSTCWEDSAR